MKRLALIAILAAACGGSGSSPASTVVSACEDAFAAAAGVDKMADSVSDLYTAVRACPSVAAWSAAFDAHNGAGFEGSATEVLRNVCLADEVAGEALCAEVQ